MPPQDEPQPPSRLPARPIEQGEHVLLRLPLRCQQCAQLHFGVAQQLVGDSILVLSLQHQQQSGEGIRRPAEMVFLFSAHTGIGFVSPK